MKELHLLNAEVAERDKEITAADRDRLRDVRSALITFEEYGGNGIADEMPLGEVIGFFEAQLEESGKSDEDLILVPQTIVVLIKSLDEGFTKQTHLGTLVRELEKEEKEILEKYRGNTRDLDSD